MLACVIVAGWPISDSTPPRLSARLNSLRPRQEPQGRVLAALEADADHAAEVAHLPLRPGRGRDGSAGRGSRRARTCGCSASQSASRRALAQCRSMRTASVLMPRSVSQASNGPGTPPAAFW